MGISLDRPIRFSIALTYRCNMACKYCNRLLNWAPWPDSDITIEDIKEGYNRVRAAKVEIEKVRVSGGEPLMHPEFVRCMETIGRTWNREYIESGARTAVFTNGLLSQPEPDGWRYRGGEPCVRPEVVENLFQPPAISPADIGLTGRCGTEMYCHRQRGCGRLFDCHGFAGCIFAGAIGRAVGIDPYEAHPVLLGREDTCRHCAFVLGIKGAIALFEMVRAGEVDYPSKTYREAFDRWRVEGPPKFRKFRER